MLDVFNIPTVQGGTNYQEFYGGGTTRDWVKPRGASMVRMLLIGAGGGGAGGGNSRGGGSGAVTQWIGPAIFIPDVLRILVGAGGLRGNVGAAGGNGNATTVIYQAKDGTGYTLLTANAGEGGSGGPGAGGSASTNNFFGASGIFQSIAGQNGSNAGTAVPESSTTFLCGGSGGGSSSSDRGGAIASKLTYPGFAATSSGTGVPGANGYFITQPLLLGFGGQGGAGGAPTGGNGGNGGIGCGGGGGGTASSNNGLGGRGGDGAVFVWAW
jgi:hypothetical protein